MMQVIGDYAMPCYTSTTELIMASPSTETRYKKMSGFATIKGQMFEVKLSALLFLRGLNSGLQFQLASNVAGAGALDDIVFRLKSTGNPGVWSTCFIQLKHKESSRVSCRMLTDPKGNFSLQKYCESYVEIKKQVSLEVNQVLFDGKIEDCMYVIYSNAKSNKDLGEGRRAVTGSIEKFLESDSGKVFSFDPYSHTEIDKAVLGCLEKFGEDGRDFLSQLRVFCGQPSESEFNGLIKDELRKVDDKIIRDIDIERLCECYIENMSVWCEQSEYILHGGSNVLVTARDRVAVETCSAQDKGKYRLDTFFQETALSTLRGVLNKQFSVLHIESSESSSRLSSTKVLQAIEGSHLFLSLESLKLHLSSVTSEWKLGRCRALILVMNYSYLPRDDSYFEMLVELFNFSTLSGKKMVVLSHGTDPVLEKLIDLAGNHVLCFKDSFAFSQINIEFRRKFLDTKFWLQGHQISLEFFFNGHGDDAIDILNGPSFVEITKMSGNLSIGLIFTDIISYYIARTLNKTTVLVESIFEISKLSESIAIIYSSMEDLYSVLRQGDSSLSNHQRVLKKLHKISESPILPNNADETFFFGENVKLGRFFCSRVGLRLGQEDQVTALRVRPRSEVSIQNSFLFLKKDVDQKDIDALSKFNITRHVMCLEDGKLEWIKSRADTMDIVRDHIDIRQATDVVSETVTDFKERLVLLCAEPGMGKSTLLSRYAKKTKEALPNFWVILIALNDHTKLLSDYKHTDAFRFLVDATNTESRLQQSMLEHALKVTGNVVVLLDGFDEIAPTYVAECCLLVSSLLETNAKKIWITSRNSIKSNLENRLSTLAAKLRKFTEGDQRNFFKLYWTSVREAAVAAGRKIIGDEALEDFISRLIEMTSRAISDREKDFMSIPLQTQMMAEVFADHVIGLAKTCTLPDKLDLLQLLDRFIEKKLGIYIQDKLKIKSSDTNYYLHLDTHRKLYLESHMEAALILIIGENDIRCLHSRSIMKNSVEFFKKIGRGEDKTGIIDCVVNDKPRFIHRVFAEYFVAKWFSENFTENVLYMMNNLYSVGFRVVRDIFDRLLAKSFELHTAVLDEDVEAVHALLERGADVNVRDLGGRTPLHLAAALGTDKNQDESDTQSAIIGELIGHSSDFSIKDDIFDATPLWYADITQSWSAIDKLLRCNSDFKHLDRTLENVRNEEMISFIITYDLDRLLNFCLDNGLDVEYKFEALKYSFSSVRRLLPCACERGSLQVATLLIDRGANIESTTSHDESPLLIAAKNGHIEMVRLLHNASSLHERTYTRSWFSFLWKILTQSLFFRNVEKIDYLDMKDHNANTALHSAARENQTSVLRYLISHGADLESADRTGATALHIAAASGNLIVVRDLLGAVNDTDQADFVNAEDRFGNTALHEASTSFKIFKLLADAGGNLTQINHAGQTLLMHAAENGCLDVVKYLVENFAKNQETKANTLCKIDYMSDRIGSTAVQLAAKNGFKNVVNFLVSEGADFRSQNKNGWTALQFAVDNSETSVVKVLLNAVDDDERADFVNTCDNYGVTSLHKAVCNDRMDLVDILVKAGAKVTAADSKRQTPLMIAVEHGCQNVIDYLLKSFDIEDLQITEQKATRNIKAINPESSRKTNYINMKDNDIGTAIHYATLNKLIHVGTTRYFKSVDIAKYLIDLGADVRIHGGLYNRTPLHLAVSETRIDIIRIFLDAVAEDERSGYVNAVDIDGDTPLHLAASKAFLDAAEMLVKAGGKLTKANNDGRTPLMLAVCFGHAKVVEYLLSTFCLDRDGMSKVQYINLRDVKGKTAWDLSKELHRDVCKTCLEKVLLQEGFIANESQGRCILF